MNRAARCGLMLGPMHYKIYLMTFINQKSPLCVCVHVGDINSKFSRHVGKPIQAL